MIKVFGQRSGDNFHCAGPFIPFIRDGKMGIRGGKVISISPQKLVEVETKKEINKDEDGSIEAYLHIKSVPASCQIREVNILSKEEVRLQKEKSDNLLNIYIPIAVAQEAKGEAVGIEESDNINTDFLFLKENKDLPFACYFDSGKVHITGYLLSETLGQTIARGGSSTPIKENEDGDPMFLVASLTLDVDTQGGLSIFNATKFSFDFVKKDQITANAVEVDYDSEEILKYASGETDVQPWRLKGSLNFNMPIGYIQQSNFIHCRPPSNVTFTVGFTTTMDYSGEFADGECIRPKYKYTRKYFINAF
tara:strand:+ start:4240 stop:5160 length:921 start_codon:yes stop_codon:yes gene_type:complete